MKSILLIDDDADFCDVMRRFLEQEEVMVYMARNGWEGLMMLDRINPDLILLDLMMPGMDGPTFLHIGQKAQRQLKSAVIVITALSASEAAQRMEGLNVAATVEKKSGFYGRVLELVHSHLWAAAARAKQREALAELPEDESEQPATAWHSAAQMVYHNNTCCIAGNSIGQESIRSGTGGKPLCQECANLNRMRG